MNKVELIGRLTRDVERRTTSSGTNTATLYIAVPNGKKNDGSGEVKADFFRAVAFGTYAEFCSKYLKQGSRIGLTGRLKSGSYDKNGIRVFYTDIYVEHIDLLSYKNSGSTTPDSDFYEDKLPFDITEE